MTIRIWRSFSCNNSSAFRLVARFADAGAAAAAAVELAALFQEVHTEGQSAYDVVTRYGLAWEDVSSWADDALRHGAPTVGSEAEVLVVYHPYCLGLGEGLRTMLEAHGGRELEGDHTLTPTVSVLLDCATPSLALDAALTWLVARNAGTGKPFDAPWGTTIDTWGPSTCFRDARTAGLYVPIIPADLPALRAWLTACDVERLSIRLCEYADEARFAAIAGARCHSCAGLLEYLDPRLHDIETEQLVCRRCGGLYDLATFMPG